MQDNKMNLAVVEDNEFETIIMIDTDLIEETFNEYGAPLEGDEYDD